MSAASTDSSPVTFENERLQGLLRWEEWLEGRLSPHGIVLEDAEDSETGDAIWRIGFRDDTRARVRVIDRALRLSQEVFGELVTQLEELDWIALLEAARPGGIRIHADGGIEEVDPEGAERET